MEYIYYKLDIENIYSISIETREEEVQDWKIIPEKIVKKTVGLRLWKKEIDVVMPEYIESDLGQTITVDGPCQDVKFPKNGDIVEIRGRSVMRCGNKLYYHPKLKIVFNDKSKLEIHRPSAETLKEMLRFIDSQNSKLFYINKR